MNVMIVDSGSSKTVWKAFSDSKEVFFTHTIGLNPYHIDSHTMAKVVREEVYDLLMARNIMLEKIYFYGAGCGTVHSKEKVCLALQNVFTSTKIFVEDDLVGATRAVGRGVSGVVAILGTGSNAALCVEGEIVRRIPSNGIWFGDEGSGASLGKELIKAYLNDDLPIDLKNAFEENYPERRAEILENVYVKPFPNRYLASFAPFVRRQLHHPFLQVLVRENFQKFFEFVLRKLSIAASHRSFYFVGSIAHFFSEILQEVADEQGIRIMRIMDQPIVGLGHYHLHEPTD